MLWCGFSGGKDSLTLMHLARPWATQIQLIHNQVDGGFPQVTENLLACAQAWGFAEPSMTKPLLDFDTYVAQYGLQAEVVPSTMDDTGLTPSPYAIPVRASSWWFCTLWRQILPLMQATLALGADAILTGSRATDAPLFAQRGMVWQEANLPGVVRYNPLQGWTTDDVWRYVNEHQIPLPPHYVWKRTLGFESPDCVKCSWQPRMWREILPQYYPEVYRANIAEVTAFYATVAHELEQSLAAMRAVLERPDASPHP